MKKVRKIPFPQANNLGLIFDILLNVSNDGISKRDISLKYDIDERQGSYYLDSLEFLGFVEKINTKYFYTVIGEKIIASENCKYIFIDEVLKNIHIAYLYSQAKDLSYKQQNIVIANYIFNNFGLGISTSKRRASSIISWISWIEEVSTKEGIKINA